MLCLISVIHSMMLLLCLQFRCLSMRREREKSELLMDVFRVSSFFGLQFRKSLVSAVFDFNASLNDAAPVSPILFPVE